MAIGELSAASR